MSESEGQAAAGAADATRWVLRLYVAGATPRSLTAVERITDLCRRYLSGRYDLQVIDIYREPAMAEEGNVVAVPTLVRFLPGPLRRVIGVMADEARMLSALGVNAGT